MKVRVVTIDREFGSGGADIAKRLAERLGWKLWDQRLTDEIARLAQCDRSQVCAARRADGPALLPPVQIVSARQLRGQPERPRLKLLDADVIVRLTQRIVQAAADGRRTRSSSGAAPHSFWRIDPTCFTCSSTRPTKTRSSD